MSSSFNYTDIHLFNKNGIELPLVIDSTIKLTLVSSHGDDAIYCCVLSKDSQEYSFHCIKEGSRFIPTSDGLIQGYVSIYGVGVKECKCICELRDTKKVSSNGINKSYAIAKVIDFDEASKFEINKDVFKENSTVGFPSTTFLTSVTFDKVSTSLAETQSLFVLGKKTSRNEVGVISEESFEPIKDIDKDFADNYKLLFFIDTRNQNDFKFFTVNENNDEITWSNKIELDLNDTSNSIHSNNFRVNIAFRTQQEGIYSENIIVFLVDKNENNVTPVGTIEMHAEAVGEDERYQTLFTNFGLPPTTSLDVFNNIDKSEALTDYQQYNINAKHLFLNYADIFPYVGTYKALVNAVKTLGYTDIFFKEWYKEIGKDIPNTGFVAYDMTYGSDKNANVIGNLSIDERIKLKKLNWLSMIYKINEELAEQPEDKYGFPQIQKIYGYNDPSIIAKLISLKEWLEKYIIGVNCRIIDVGGEGIYYERYPLDTYGTYQKIIEWNNDEKNLAPDIDLNETNTTLIDSSANIYVNINPNNDNKTTLESISERTFSSFCEGVFDEKGIYSRSTNSNRDDLIYAGNTLDFADRFKTYQIKASSKLESFIFNDEYILKTDKEKSASLRVNNDLIKFSPYDLYNGASQYSIFKNPPIIKIESGNIRKKSSSWNNVIYKINASQSDEDGISYVLDDVLNHKSTAFNDYITLIPPTHDELNNNDEFVTLIPNGSSVKDTFERITKETIAKSDSSSGEPYHTFESVNTTYGLRYAIDDFYHLPMFMIRDYKFDLKGNDIDNIHQEQEYVLEILDGKMIFNDYDGERNKTIYLNFNFDKKTNKQTVEVNIEYLSDTFSFGKYLDTDVITNFTYGKTYNQFIENYKSNPETAISYNLENNKEFIKSIKVNNTGEFIVDVYGLDIHNNIFAAKCHTNPKVYMPEISMTTYSNYKSGNASKIDDNTKSDLIDNFSEFCIYDTNYLITDVVKDSSLSIKYPTYSYSLKTPNEDDIVNFMDIKDRYKVLAIDQLYNSTNFYHEDDATNETYSLVTKKYSKHDYINIVDANDNYAAQLMMIDFEDNNNKNVTDYLFDFNDSSLNYTNVNVMYFNELGGYPLAQTYGQMANDLAFGIDSSYDGKYRLAVQDQSDRSYVWCSLKENVANKLENEFKTYISDKYKNLELRSINDILHLVGINDSSVLDIDYDIKESLDKYSQDTFDVLSKNTELLIDALDDVDLIRKEITNIEELHINELANNSKYLDTSINYILGTDAAIKQKAKIEIAALSLDSCVLNDKDISVESEKFDICCFTSLSDYKTYPKYLDIVYKDVDNLIRSANIDDVVNYYVDMYDIKLTQDIISLTNGKNSYKLDNMSIFDVLANEILNIEYVKEDGKVSTIDSAIKSYLHGSFVLDKEYKQAIVKQMLETIDVLKLSLNVNNKSKIYSSLLDKFISLNGLFKNVVLGQTNKDTKNQLDSLKRAVRTTRRTCVLNIIKEQIYSLQDESNSLYAYVNIAFFICVYILERLLDNVSDTGLTGVIKEDKQLTIYDMFVLRTEANIQSVLYNYLYSLNKYTYEYFIESAVDETYPTSSKCIYTSLNYNSSYLKEYIEKYDPANSKCNLYDKMLANYAMHVIDKVIINIDEQGNTNGNNIITKGKIDVNLKTDDAGEKHRNFKDLLYAVSFKRKDDNNLLYAKTSKYLNDGYSHVTREVPHNTMPHIKDVLSKDYMSVYVRPSWDLRVNVSVVDNYEDFGLKKTNNYDNFLLVTYYTVAFMPTFNIGDIVKISFKDLLTSEYVGQASYEIVAFTNNKYSFIVKGNINDSYLSKNNEDLWIPCALKPYISGNKLSKCYLIDNDEKTYYDSIIDTSKKDIIQYVNREVKINQLVENIKHEVIRDKRKVNVLEEVKCIDNPGFEFVDESGEKLEDSVIPETIVLKKICAVSPTSGRSFPVHIRASVEERIVMSVSYAHHAYVNYPVKVAHADEDIHGMTHISFDNTKLNKRYLDFIDSTFGVTITSFNISEGINAWMNYTDNVGELPKPKLLDKNVYEYRNISLELVKNESNNIVFKANLDNYSSDDIYMYWRVYKMTDTTNKHKFMFESYNKYLYLDYNEKGIYDIEANVFDKYGNKSTRMFKGAYVIK